MGGKIYDSSVATAAQKNTKKYQVCKDWFCHLREFWRNQVTLSWYNVSG